MIVNDSLLKNWEESSLCVKIFQQIQFAKHMSKQSIHFISSHQLQQVLNQWIVVEVEVGVTNSVKQELIE
jgi:hypothetical protein